MSYDDFLMHYVSTLSQARALIDAHDRFWVSNCGCREGKGRCKRSRIDVCLAFYPGLESSGSGKKEVTRSQVDSILIEARDRFLVARPYRSLTEHDVVEGICFCCDDCCAYFTNPNEKCDKGSLIELTDMDACTQCGACTTVCYFGARTMQNGEMVVDREACYGCGLCVDACTVGCIQMVERI